MIKFETSFSLYMCESYNKQCSDQVITLMQDNTVSPTRLLLCDECKEKLVTLLLFRRNKNAAID